MLVTGLGSGYSPVAPGTMGALVACLIWLIFYFFLPFNVCQIATFILTLVVTIVAIPLCSCSEKMWGPDPSRVVVDEMVGVWIPLLSVPDNEQWWIYLIASFILFRLFDIFKPLGIRQMEKLPGGLGIMMDDILAGAFSLMILVGYRIIDSLI